MAYLSIKTFVYGKANPKIPDPVVAYEAALLAPIVTPLAKVTV